MTKQLIAIFDLDRTLYDDRERMEKYSPKDLEAAAQDDSLWDEYHAHHDEDEFIPYTKEKALKLQAEGAILYFVTYRGEEHRFDTVARLNREGFAVGLHNLYTRTTGTKPKMPEFRVQQAKVVISDVVTWRGIEDPEFVFFDDNFKNCQAVAASGLVHSVEQIEYSHNLCEFIGYNRPLKSYTLDCHNDNLPLTDRPSDKATFPCTLQGKRVRKTGGSFEHTGTVVSEFRTLAGEPRIVLEFDEPVSGMLHVYRPDQVTVI